MNNVVLILCTCLWYACHLACQLYSKEALKSNSVTPLMLTQAQLIFTVVFIGLLGGCRPIRFSIERRTVLSAAFAAVGAWTTNESTLASSLLYTHLVKSSEPLATAVLLWLLFGLRLSARQIAMPQLQPSGARSLPSLSIETIAQRSCPLCYLRFACSVHHRGGSGATRLWFGGRDGALECAIICLLQCFQHGSRGRANAQRFECDQASFHHGCLARGFAYCSVTNFLRRCFAGNRRQLRNVEVSPSRTTMVSPAS